MDNVIRCQNLVPEGYISTSRDFQLFCRLYDCLLNGAKNDLDSIVNSLNTYTIPSELLTLLSTKLGFFVENTLTSENLRILLTAFPTILKYKGSRQGITYAINVFSKIKNVSYPISVIINNVDYKIIIVSEKQVTDIQLLLDLLQHILPTGYTYEYQYDVTDATSDNIVVSQNVNVY